MHEYFRDSLPLHTTGVEEDRSSLENNGSSRGPYDILTINCKLQQSSLELSTHSHYLPPEKKLPKTLQWSVLAYVIVFLTFYFVGQYPHLTNFTKSNTRKLHEYPKREPV